MIMSSLELLHREPQPSEERIRAWLKGNFCRCTGYQHIVDAIAAAGATAAPGRADEATTQPAARVFGQPLTRREDDHHLRGRGRFTDDIRVADRPAFCMSPCCAARTRMPGSGRFRWTVRSRCRVS